MPSGRELHRRSTGALSLVMVVIGIALIVVAIANGGGPISYGVIVGLLFVAAGGGRLYLATRGS
jgi:hypothetical protein